MIIKKKNLFSVFQTGQEMRRLASFYCADLGRWLDVPFIVYYRFVCSLPYVPDPPDVETVSRPLFTLNADYAPRDCDDKAVLLAAWLVAHGQKVRFVASSTRKDRELHHTFLQMENGLFIDATYKKNENCLGFYPYFHDITRLVALTEFF